MAQEATLELPEFGRPPLDEVAAGAQFTPLQLRLADIGAVHGCLAAEYPDVVDVPPLPPSFESFGPLSGGSTPFSVLLGANWRTWFVSKNEEHLVQLQTDRLIANWRFRPTGGPYPRYQEVRHRFSSAAAILEKFARSRDLPPMEFNQCELTYFNKVPVPENRGFAALGELLQGFEKPGLWGSQFLDAQFIASRIIFDSDSKPFGRLTIECSPLLDPEGQKFWRLAITMRGRPANGSLEAATAFLDDAHSRVVSCFTEITVEDLQYSQWGRKR